VDLRLMQVKRNDKFTMKTKLQIFLAVFSIVFSIARVSAQQPMEPGEGGDVRVSTDGFRGGPFTTTTSTSRTFPERQTGLPQSMPPRPPPMAFDPQTGLPVSVPDIDPATGLPADGSPPFKDTNGVATWIDPNWKDPNKALAAVNYPAFPLSEVANRLLTQFNNSFDIIFPTASVDPTQINVVLRLNNVKASEIFSAMNLQFELDRIPARWELTLNGSRPTAILRSLPQLAPPAPPQIRKVFFVGDMLDEYPGTNDEKKLGDLSGKINDAWNETAIEGGKIHIYPSGQLVIVSGTPEQVDLAEQILRALKEKTDYETSRPRQQPVNPN
jgi:hypothetical protein